VTLRHYENKARRAFWLVHLEAWRQSGLTKARYCRDHRLDVGTFTRWLAQIVGAEEARKHSEYQAELRREERRKRQQRKPRHRFAISTDMRSRAVQAFWAMHVEAMSWSGMSVRDYAAALCLSLTSLSKWRDRLQDGEVDVDWRAHLHPSARPVVSDITNGRAAGQLLTRPTENDPPAPVRPARRFFSDEDKRAIVQESEARGATVSAVARRHGLATGLLFRWRADAGLVPKRRAKLASVTLTSGQSVVQLLQDIMAETGTALAEESRAGCIGEADRMPTGGGETPS
jgi:transposase-like protein